MRRYECTEGGSAKFWEVHVEGKALTVRFGKIGTGGTVQTKSFASADAARAEMAKLIKQKLGKGYSEKNASATTSVASRDLTAKFVDRVLQLSDEKAAKKIEKALASGGGEAPVLDAILVALAGAVEAKALPAWLVVPHAPLERVLHLAPPLFDAVAADGDEFWGESPEQAELVWNGTVGTRRSPRGDDEEIGKLQDAV